MKKKVGMLLLLMGLLFAAWNGSIWLSEMSSGQETIDENDLAQAGGTDRVAVSTEALVEEEVSPSLVKEEQPSSRNYEEYERGEEVGWLLIPALNKKYPVYWGTDDDTLTQGVGYHVGNFTTPPDGNQHTVLAGHRDTVFRELGNLKEGDAMFVQFEDVQYEYKIKRTWITHAEDRSVIVAKNEPILTLTTCYPFNFLGAAPDRYIIEAPLVDITDIN